MKRYEYKVVTIDIMANRLEDVINRFASDLWRLTSALVPPGAPMSVFITLIFEREVQ